jgi:hypothetical protein
MDRSTVARLLLVPLLLAIAVAAWDSRGHSAPSVDARTYIEMTRGVLEHGVPYFDNGPVDRFPEMAARWNASRSGKLWGTYPPLFPYLAAPLLGLGGLPAISHFNTALLFVLVAGAFLLARRATGDPLFGVAGAYLTVASTPLAAISFDISPFILATALITWAVYFALLALESEGHAAARAAASAGFFGGLSCAAHLLNVPMLGALLLVLIALPWGYARTRASLRIGVMAIGAAMVALAPVAVLNVARFGTPSPATYGPCVWHSCRETGLGDQSFGAMIAYAFPVLVWLAGGAALLWLGRRSRAARLCAFGVIVVAFVVWGPMRRHAANIATLTWAYVVDCSTLEIPPMQRATDGLGNFFGPFVIRSTLQETPILLVALLAPFRERADRVRAVVLGAPVAALLASLALRANQGQLVHALGFPFMHLRYVFPAVPAMVVLALVAVRGLPWSRANIVFVVVLASVLGAWIMSFPDDMPYVRRLVLLRGALAVAAVAGATTWLARRRPRWSGAATWAVSTAAAFGLAINTTIDLNVIHRDKHFQDARVDAVAAHTPERFAIIGWAPEIDTPLALRATRDIEYADMYENGGPLEAPHVHSLLEHWSETGRPIFALLPTHVKWDRSPWEDYDLRLVDEHTNLFAIRKR